MRVLKTMNTLGEIKKEDFAGLSIADSAPNYRRVGKTIEKVESFAANRFFNEWFSFSCLSDRDFNPLRFFGFTRCWRSGNNRTRCHYRGSYYINGKGKELAPMDENHLSVCVCVCCSVCVKELSMCLLITGEFLDAVSRLIRWRLLSTLSLRRKIIRKKKETYRDKKS